MGLYDGEVSMVGGSEGRVALEEWKGDFVDRGRFRVPLLLYNFYSVALCDNRSSQRKRTYACA